ncbi:MULTISPECIES: hypothetical protein [Flavobacterium]|uniref:Uncharacterized protein n=1 Tax=Flavobacterium commune TaxID=1306519 RepID=A0A1D9PCH5_9FLAO|nr:MULTISPECIES: hypothetical protein [Flavobacterium]APA00301.1 hypothetical protein BIW12_13190 [Flavobacterium commune]
MKSIKFIYIIILSLLTFCGGVELYKYSSESNNCLTKDIFLDSDVSQVESSSVSMSCDIKMHFILKKKAKTRVEDSKTRVLKNIYYTNFVGLKFLKENIIFSAASLYQIQQHIHLHLYQLF